MNRYMEVLRERRLARRRRGEASWFVLTGLAIVFVGALAGARSLPSWAALLAIVGAFALLGVAGLIWGADSRDGSDWSDRRPGSIR